MEFLTKNLCTFHGRMFSIVLGLSILVLFGFGGSIGFIGDLPGVLRVLMMFGAAIPVFFGMLISHSDNKWHNVTPTLFSVLLSILIFVWLKSVA